MFVSTAIIRHGLRTQGIGSTPSHSSPVPAAVPGRRTCASGLAAEPPAARSPAPFATRPREPPSAWSPDVLPAAWLAGAVGQQYRRSSSYRSTLLLGWAGRNPSLPVDSALMGDSQLEPSGDRSTGLRAMKTRTFARLALLLSLGCAGRAVVPPVSAQPAGDDPAIKALLETIRGETQVPGIAVAVVGRE